MNKKPKLFALRRRQIDRVLSSVIKQLKPIYQPKAGWIKDIRTALGMTGTQFAKRLDISASAVTQLEENEAKGTVTLNTLKKAAEVLGFQMVYFFIPNQKGKGSRQPLEDMVQQRAKQIATRMVEELSTSMALEKQNIANEEKKRQIQEILQKLLDSESSKLWKE